MIERKQNSLKDGNRINSDLARLDALEIAKVEYDDLPDWTDAMIEEADLYENGKLIRQGRQRTGAAAQSSSLDRCYRSIRGDRPGGKPASKRLCASGWRTMRAVSR
jgi:hypothetical protein